MAVLLDMHVNVKEESKYEGSEGYIVWNWQIYFHIDRVTLTGPLNIPTFAEIMS